MPKILPHLWFDSQALEAAQFYVGIFKNAAILETTHYVEGSHKPVGSVLTVRFVLDGQEFTGINGGPHYRFTPAVSFMVRCEDQQELDRMWDALMDGGEASMCGWLTDKFGVSWQVAPVELLEMLTSKDTAAAQRATQAMLNMVKLELEPARRAFAGK